MLLLALDGFASNLPQFVLCLAKSDGDCIQRAEGNKFCSHAIFDGFKSLSVGAFGVLHAKTDGPKKTQLYSVISRSRSY